MLEPDFKTFWTNTLEYGWVEVKWWCDDRGLDVEKAWAKVRPDFFHIRADGVLRPVRGQRAWDAARGKVARGDRQFAFVDGSMSDRAVLRALRERIEAMHGRRLPQALRFVKGRR